MSNLQCVIVDDEPIARSVLRQYVEDAPGIETIKECSSALELLSFLKNGTADLILLDINMPKLTGVELLKANTIDIPVIFTTAYPEYALEGYELNVIDYLLKPISFSRFLQAIEKVEQKEVTEETTPSFTVKADGKTYRIDPASILLVESKGDYISIHTEELKVLVYMTMKKVLELTGSHLVRVHKSFAVALQKISYVEGNCIYIGEKEIPIGNAYKEDFASKFK